MYKCRGASHTEHSIEQVASTMIAYDAGTPMRIHHFSAGARRDDKTAGRPWMARGRHSADFLVNLYEDGLPLEAQRHAYETAFQTESCTQPANKTANRM